MAYDESAEAEVTEADNESKLRLARKRFEDACDHHQDAHAEAHRAQQFFHNTDCEGQWDPDQLAYLREQLRPVMSFNIVKPKVETMVGMYADAQRRAVVMASSAKQKLLADVIEIVKDQTLQDAKYERLAARQFRTGVITGECSLQVEIVPSSKGKDWIDVKLYRLMPFETHWDPASIEPDRSDARWVFADRWFSKGEFKKNYPEHAAEFDTLVGGEPDEADSLRVSSEGGMEAIDQRDDYGRNGSGRYYADRKKHMIRVIRYEYKETEPAFFVTDETTGQRMEIDETQVEAVELMIGAYGEPLSLEKSDREVVRVCEFIGTTILAEYDEAGPFDGFSVVTFSYMIDEETGTAYGFVRNLFDPQQELNKSKSWEQEYIAQSAAPGVTAEDGAIPDLNQFRTARRTPGDVAVVKKGALTAQTVQERQPPPPNPAIMARTQGAVELLSEISGIPSAAVFSPSEQAQAGMTVAIRYHKSRQTVQDPFSNFEDAQRETVRKVVQAITRSMPDDQIAAILGRDDRFRVQGGTVYEVEEDERTGQMRPVGAAQINGLRDMDWKLEFEHASENSTLRMMELDMLLQLKTAGFPVDPEMAVEKATSSRTERERLKKFAKQASQAEAMAAQRESEAFSESTRGALMIEARKGQETARHNQATEFLQAQKQEQDTATKMVALWNDADENEKARIFETLRLAIEHDTAMRQANTRG
jgi:hypothetical protein